MINNKKAVSPLVATILLIVFSLILGTVTMNLGKAYIEGITEIEPSGASVDTGQERITQYIGDSLYECVHYDNVENKCLQWAIA
mgnify:CR=1 FL=1